MFSVGVLYSAYEFIEFVSRTPEIDTNFSITFRTFAVASPRAILELSQKCEWVQLNYDGRFELTDRGKEVISNKELELALRVQIGHLIESYLPTWLPLLSRGRLETQKYLPADALQCFSEAGLFSKPTDDIVAWWDKYSKVSRKTRRDNNLDVGRRGEKLTIAHERSRTNREPVWQGFETNLAGYDVLSVVNSEDLRPLCIEVKASNSKPNVASFFVSKNEWNVATTSENGSGSKYMVCEEY